MGPRENWGGWAALALLAWGAGPAVAAPMPYPPRTILLFVASWCAPCHGEIAQLPRLTEAARPYAVTVVPIDRGRATAAMLVGVPATQRWVPDAAALATIRDGLFGGTAGLPFSVAIGGDGRVCGEHRGVLSPGKVEAMRRGCG
ncbi:TlpA family protein disulfide reductase [Sphingomonas hankookensis]|uniref:TlpA family protein disulfide reductase n=1 Tax=Sphingomonas hankookensis TaxID=563996 RepID=UPI001F5AC5CC|nr:hypothetical protein [Sphingomonas hankookensis]